eukprot:COSAG02_NODE_28457_length_589_cov_0.893878_1_plen_35_part_01
MGLTVAYTVPANLLIRAHEADFSQRSVAVTVVDDT